MSKKYRSVIEMLKSMPFDGKKQFITDMKNRIWRNTKMRELKERIKLSGINRKELAQRIGISYTMLNQYLNGFSKMPESIREKIERELTSR